MSINAIPADLVHTVFFKDKFKECRGYPMRTSVWRLLPARTTQEFVTA